MIYLYVHVYVVCIHFISIGFLCKLDLSLVYSHLENRGATVFQGSGRPRLIVFSFELWDVCNIFFLSYNMDRWALPSIISNWRDLDHRPHLPNCIWGYIRPAAPAQQQPRESPVQQLLWFFFFPAENNENISPLCCIDGENRLYVC